MSNVTLATQLGMNSEATPRDTHTVDLRHAREDSAHTPHAGPWPVIDNDKDYFIERDGVKFAGTHLIIDLWGASYLDDMDTVEQALREAADVSGATLLHTHLHHFSPNGGISGVLVLAESHISIHTWPEKGYAALDVFMCGDCDPWKSIPVLKKHFHPDDVTLGEHKRGLTVL